MEHILLLISQYLNDPHNLYLISKDWYRTMCTLRYDIVITSMHLYPNSISCMDIWRRCILDGNIDIISDILAIVPFSNRMYRWWTHMLDMIGRCDLVEHHMPYGLCNRTTIPIDGPMDIHKHHINDMINTILSSNDSNYKDIILAVIQDIPITVPTNMTKIYHTWILLTDAYRSYKHICPYGSAIRGRIVIQQPYNHIQSPYYTYERSISVSNNRDAIASCITISMNRILQNRYNVGHIATIYSYIDIHTLVDIMVKNNMIGVIYNTTIEDILIRKGIDPIWLVHLFDSGSKPTDIPIGLWLYCLRALISNYRDINIRYIDRLLLVYRRYIDKSALSYMLTDGDQYIVEHVMNIVLRK